MTVGKESVSHKLEAGNSLLVRRLKACPTRSTNLVDRQRPATLRRSFWFGLPPSVMLADGLPSPPYPETTHILKFREWLAGNGASLHPGVYFKPGKYFPPSP